MPTAADTLPCPKTLEARGLSPTHCDDFIAHLIAADVLDATSSEDSSTNDDRVTSSSPRRYRHLAENMNRVIDEWSYTFNAAPTAGKIAGGSKATAVDTVIPDSGRNSFFNSFARRVVSA